MRIVYPPDLAPGISWNAPEEKITHCSTLYTTKTLTCSVIPQWRIGHREWNLHVMLSSVTGSSGIIFLWEWLGGRGAWFKGRGNCRAINHNLSPILWAFPQDLRFVAHGSDNVVVRWRVWREGLTGEVEFCQLWLQSSRRLYITSIWFLHLFIFRRFYAKISHLHSEVYSGPETMMANPLVAFTLIKRLQSEWMNTIYSNEAMENAQGDLAVSHCVKSQLHC